MVHTPEESVLYVCAKFEMDSSIPSKVIRGYQNFEIGSRDPGHANFGVVLVHTQEGPSSTSVPNLRWIAVEVNCWSCDILMYVN